MAAFKTLIHKGAFHCAMHIHVHLIPRYETVPPRLLARADEVIE